jgi:hypothetical protein
MKSIKISATTQRVLREHNIPISIYNQFDKEEKIAFSTQLRRWGRVSSPHLLKKLMWARLKTPALDHKITLC